MSTETEARLSTHTEILKIKAKALSFLTLFPATDDEAALADELMRLKFKMPQLLSGAPVLLDLSEWSSPTLPSLRTLMRVMTHAGLKVLALRSENTHLRTEAEGLGLHVFSGLPTSSSPQERTPSPTAHSAPPSEATPELKRSEPLGTRLILQSVRSGQHIYARQSDLIVTGSVSPGAELIADGHIHIYGTLRGRAIAGATGFEEARIFCRKMEAEMIAIAGIFKIQEDLPRFDADAPAMMAYLDEGRIQFTPC